MTAAEPRICSATGLRLVPVDQAAGFHVAKSRYAQPSAPWRTPDVHRQEWGRFDTLGRTYYVAETAECAYAEVLSQYKRKAGEVDPLAPIAAALDLTVDQLLAQISEDWGEEDYRAVGAIPARWRSERRMYQLAIEGDGWLVDVAHPATISALESAHDGVVSRFLANQGIPALNVSVLTSDNRYVTTMLAEIMRDAELDDGTTPRGVHFGSKHGGAWCRAIWLPYQEEMPTGLAVVNTARIDEDDPALTTVAGWLHLRSHNG
ncbi:hypothetical protein ACF1AJ_20120 [Leifsonia sp. NPDC014704]|uniref:hypothetical protein n=1 Tax=Leifsonia sp. NPDC014704 TaxID=3364123 RepID=UPI000F128BD3